MGPLLLAAVAAPALAAAATWRLSSPLGRTVVQWAAFGAAAIWVVATAVGEITVGPLGVAGSTGPAAAGVALAAAAVRRPLRRLPAALTGLAASVATGGLSMSGGEGAPVDAAAGLVAAALLVTLATRLEADGGLLPAAVALAGAALVGFGIADLDGAGLPSRGTLDGGTTWPVLAGAVLVVVAAAVRPRRSLAPLLPAALGVALPVLPLAAAGGGPAAAVLAVGAAALAVRPAGVRLRPPALGLRPTTQPAAAIAVLALGSALLPGTLDAAVLLAAAAVVAHVAAVPVAAAAALPGAATLALAVADEAVRTHVTVAAAAVVVAVGVTLHALRDDLEAGDDGARPGAWTALALGAWLLAAPHTWTWTEASAPRGWGSGAIVAATGATVALAVLTDLGNRTIPLGRLDAVEPLAAGDDTRRREIAAAAAAVLAAAAGLALFLSVAR